MKQITKLFACVVIILIMTISCCKDVGFETDDTIAVYKMKSEYSEYYPIQLSEDKSHITGSPGPIDETSRPISLAQGYFMGNNCGVRTAYCSITIEEYNENRYSIGPDSLYNLIMDDDPYTEYYIGNNIYPLRKDHIGIDTAFINSLIIDIRLEDYFDRIK
jgi:hypothetical protein